MRADIVLDEHGNAMQRPAEVSCFALLVEYPRDSQRIGVQFDHGVDGRTTSIDLFNAVPPTPLDLTIRDLFARAAASVGVEAPVLLSGAGHDAQNLALAALMNPHLAHPKAKGVPH